MKKECRICALYSGSGGNSVYIRVGESRILIDAGKSARALCKALERIGESIDNIDAIFITHEHNDHISALRVLAKKNNIPIHITHISARRFDDCDGEEIDRLLCRHDVSFCECIGEIAVSSFRTPHDSNMSVGYRVDFEIDGEKHSIGYATDIGYVSDEVRNGLWGCDAVVIESNHDEDMLRTGPYPRELKNRVASKRGHLSNRECSEFACELAQNGTRSFLLAHLSKENNEPTLAFELTNRLVEEYGAEVVVAMPDDPSELSVYLSEEENSDKRQIYNPWNA